MAEKEGTFLEQIGNSVLNAGDLFVTKVNDIGNILSAPADYLIDNMFGEQRKSREEIENYRNTLVKNIKNRRAELDRYAEANPIKGVFARVGSSFAEQTLDPIQFASNWATEGFWANAIQNTLDYAYEETNIMGRDFKDFNANDLVNVGMGIGMAGVTSKFEFKGEIKPLYDETLPLEKLIKANEEHKRTVDYKAMAELQIRKDSGQTLSIPKNHKIDIEKTINDGVIPRLKKLSEETTKFNLGEKYKTEYLGEVSNVSTHMIAKKIAENKTKIKREIDIMTKPIFTEVELGKDQALGEIAEDLSKIIINGKNYDGYTPIRDIVKKSVEGIKSETFVKIMQGKEVENQYKPFQDMIRKYVNEYITIKSGVDYTGKEDGHFLETLYNKQFIMTSFKDALEDPVKTFMVIKQQLKNVGEKINLTDEEALKIGLEKGGTYNINETPQLLKQLYLDINSTTKDVAKSTRKGTVDIDGNTMFDIALKWANMENKDTYKSLLEKMNKGEKLTEIEERFRKDFQNEMLDKFESIFKGYENDPAEVLRRIFSTVVDERSGYNKVNEIFSPFDTAYKVGEEVTQEIKWLDFTMDKNMIKPFKEKIESFRSLNSYKDLKPKIYTDLSTDDKIIKGLRDLSSYKLLFGVRHLREATPNATIINEGAIRLGFDNRYSVIKSNADMAKIHYTLARNVDKNLNANLSEIADPLEKFQTEMFIKKILGNRHEFDGTNLGSMLQRGGEVAGSGQLVSDVHRTAGAYKMTAHCMLDELPNMKYNELKPELRALLKNNGINELELGEIQTQLKSFKGWSEFLDYAINGTEDKLQSLFHQIADVMGKEFDAYDKSVASVEGKSFASKLWINTSLIFRRYSMGAFNRTINSIGSYYDSNDILRSRFSLNNPKNIFRNINFKDSKFYGTNLAKMSIGLGLATQATSWIQGKAFGTSSDEIVEAKFEALANGDILPVLADAMTDSIADYIGYDVMFGGRNAPYGIIDGTYKGLQRMFTSDLDPAEKILYGTLFVIAPSNISRGIDNIKFGKNITTKLNTWSEEAQFLWKYDYRKRALEEQLDGELPVEALVKDTFSKLTDWKEYFNKNEDRAYEVTNFDRNVDKEVVKTTATGIMELAEENMRNDHINYSFSFEDIQEREKTLKEFGMDYKSQLKKLDKKTRDLFNYVMAFKQVDDPLYVIMALEEMTTSKNKIQTLKSFLNEEDLPMFDSFVENIMRHEEKKKEIARRGYEDTTEGYIQFLHTLRNEL